MQPLGCVFYASGVYATRRVHVMSDQIVKSTTLRAPLERVWHAISDAKAFGSWFGMTIDGPSSKDRLPWAPLR
jgi:hypothetical protein